MTSDAEARFVYVALWRTRYEGDSLIGVFTSQSGALEAAQGFAGPESGKDSTAIVQRWPLDTVTDDVFGPAPGEPRA